QGKGQVLKAIPLAELKCSLSRWLRYVRGGRDVTVLERGRPVARLSPLSVAACSEEVLAGLVSSGLVREPVRELPAEFFEAEPVAAEESILAGYILERGKDR